MQDKEQVFNHLNQKGEVHMVDVLPKAITSREAIAEAIVKMNPATLNRIIDGNHHKGDVFATARIAGIQAAKKTSELIPLCHPLFLTHISIEIKANKDKNQVEIEAKCALEGKTGVEMEALTAASVAALTIYDMCKAIQKDIVIESIQLVSKKGGKSGEFKRSSHD